MKTIEDIVYSAISHGKRDELFNIVDEVRKEEGSPTELKDLFQEAYNRVVTRL